MLKLDPMLILDSNSKFRNYLLNLDIRNFALVPHKLSPDKLGYPWVMRLSLGHFSASHG